MNEHSPTDGGFLAWLRLIRFWLGVWVGGEELRAAVNAFGEDERKRYAEASRSIKYVPVTGLPVPDERQAPMTATGRQMFEALLTKLHRPHPPTAEGHCPECQAIENILAVSEG